MARNIARAARKNRRAVAYHKERRLKEASALYVEMLRLEPPRQPTTQEQERARRYAPLLYVTPTEPLPLQDFAVILHPERPIIAYHMFWEDDIDFPDDNEPCDHEVVWVTCDPDSNQVTGVYAFYHSRLLMSQEAIDEANQNGGRPTIYVQWGKHGSLRLT